MARRSAPVSAWRRRPSSSFDRVGSNHRNVVHDDCSREIALMNQRLANIAPALLLVLTSVVSAAAGTVTSTPEIGGSTVSTGLGLLAAGLLIVRSRRRSK